MMRKIKRVVHRWLGKSIVVFYEYDDEDKDHKILSIKDEIKKYKEGIKHEKAEKNKKNKKEK